MFTFRQVKMTEILILIYFLSGINIALTDSNEESYEEDEFDDISDGTKFPMGPIVSYIDESAPSYDEEEDDYSFLVSIQYVSGRNNSKHICSGTVLSENWILTAAHCVCYPHTTTIVKPANVYIIFGLESLEELDLSNKTYSIRARIIHVHPDYSFEKIHNDIALVGLSVPLNISQVQPIRLKYNKEKNALKEKFSGVLDEYEVCLAIGWSQDYIHEIYLAILTSDHCQDDSFEIHDSQICTILSTDELEDDICQEESGGPLICEKQQIGVATFRLGCGAKDTPSIFTKVDEYIPWIEQVTNMQFTKLSASKRSSYWGRRRPGGWRPPNRPNRPWRPNRPNRPWRPGRPNRPWRPGRPNRPWRPGRPHRPYNPIIRGKRPGGIRAYHKIGMYANRRTYIRRYGGYGYYGIVYRPYGLYPMGIWWGRPILFYYRPWFYLDFYLWHLYFWSHLLRCHCCYGYGYYGHGPTGSFSERPPASYVSSYCMSGGTKMAETKMAETTLASTTYGNEITQCSIANSSSAYVTSSTEIVNVEKSHKRVKRSENQEGFMKEKCKGEHPKFYTETYQSPEEACEKHKIFCPSSQRPEPKISFLLLLILYF